MVLEHYLTEGRVRIESRKLLSRPASTGGAWRLAPCLRVARVRGWANPTNSGLFRRARDLRETTHCMQNAARRTSVQRDNFRDALLTLATATRIYRYAAGPWQIGMFCYGRGQHDKEKLRCCFSTQSALT